MQKIGDSTSTANADGEYTEGNAAAGVDATLLKAEWLNAIQRELIAVVQGAGLALDKAKYDQVLTAIKVIVQGAATNYAVDTGTAGVYKAAFTPPITTLADGTVVRIKIKSANPGASTFSPDGQPDKPIVGSAHIPLQGGEFVANGYACLQYNSSIGGGSWVVLASTGGAQQGGTATKSQQVLTKGQADNTYATLASPVLTGNPQGPTQTGADNSTKLATTAQVQAAIVAALSGRALSSIGYQKLPGGLIVQWGEVSVSVVGGSYQAFSFPLRFPQICFVAIGGRKALGSNALMLVGQSGGDPAGQVIFQNFGATAEIGQYIAIGY